MSGIQRTVQRLVSARLIELNAPDWAFQTVAEALWEEPVREWREWLVCLAPGVWEWCETRADVQRLREHVNTATPHWVANIFAPLNDELADQLEAFLLFPVQWNRAHPAPTETRR